MAVTIPPRDDGTGTTSPDVATDTVGGEHYQFVKPDLGGAGASQAVSVNSGTADAGTQRVTHATDVDVREITGHTTNEALKEAAAVGGQLDDTATTAATEDNVAAARITAQRAFHTNLRNNAGTEIGTTTTPVREAGTLTNNNAAPGATNVGVLPALVNSSQPTFADGNQSLLSVDTGGRVRVLIGGVASAEDTGNSTTTPLGISGVFTGSGVFVLGRSAVGVNVFADQNSATGGLSLQWSSNGSNWDITETHTIAANVGRTFVSPIKAERFRIVYTNGGTGQGVFRLETILYQSHYGQYVDGRVPVGAIANAVSPTLVEGRHEEPRLDLSGNLRTTGVGRLDHDVANAAGNNPAVLGYEAIAHGTNPTAVAAADVTKSYANRAGIPFTIGGHPNIVSRQFRSTAGETDTDILGAIGGGTKVVVTMIAVTVDNATTVDVKCRIGFGAASVPAEPADGAGVNGMVLSHGGIAAGSGVVKGSGSGIVAIGGDGEELRMTCDAPTTGELNVDIHYYTIES